MKIKRVIPLYHDVNTWELCYDYNDATGEELPDDELIDPRPLQDEVYEQKEELEIKRGLRRDKKRSGDA